jgi:Matrixin
VTRLPLIACLLTMLLLPATAAASGGAKTRKGGAGIVHSSALSHAAALERLAAGDPPALAETLAERYWGAVPCGGNVAILAAQPLAAGLEASTDGWATFESSLGANDLQAPASTYTGCTISLARWQWPERAAMAGDWNMFCLTVVHEMGHLLGHPHSLTPGSVMAPVFNDESSVPAICRSSRIAVEAGAGLLALR